MFKLFVGVDKKYKDVETVNAQIAEAKSKAENKVGDKAEIVASVDGAEYAWFVDEWEDDVQCYKDHEYCKGNGVKILHDKSEFWNRSK